jgi:hypothetical protein
VTLCTCLHIVLLTPLNTLRDYPGVYSFMILSPWYGSSCGRSAIVLCMHGHRMCLSPLTMLPFTPELTGTKPWLAISLRGPSFTNNCFRGIADWLQGELLSFPIAREIHVIHVSPFFLTQMPDRAMGVTEGN